VGNRRVILALGLALAGANVAHADEVDDLEAKGQELAKQSEYTQAIAAFKQADAKRPRAAHACMIGLAYMRREAWPQAELFLALCEKRAAPGDQPPDWTDEAEKQLAQKLSAAQIPAVTIDVSPANVGARLTVSSFAPDEVFDPQTIHLAPGKHIIEVTAPGFRTEHRDVVIEPARPEHVTIVLVKESPQIGTFSQQDPRTKPGSRSKVPWILGGVGVAFVAAGGIYHATAVRSAYDLADNAETTAAYDAYLGDFSDRRAAAVALYATGAVTIGLAVVLRYTVFKDPPLVTAHVDDRGAGILVGWRR
jgi:hypothetical protein